MKNFIAIAALGLAMFLASLAVMSTDFGHDTYCLGKISAIDPWC